MRNVELMLAYDRVHGDLSAYNVLYRDGEVRIIDFPQAVDPRFNSNALYLLERDIEHLCRTISSGLAWRRTGTGSRGGCGGGFCGRSCEGEAPPLRAGSERGRCQRQVATLSAEIRSAL